MTYGVCRVVARIAESAYYDIVKCNRRAAFYEICGRNSRNLSVVIADDSRFYSRICPRRYRNDDFSPNALRFLTVALSEPSESGVTVT